jgi:hypothetical protein
MKLQVYFIIAFFLLFITQSSGQVTKGQAMVALDQLLNSENNKIFKKTLQDDVAFISQDETFNAGDYNALRQYYEEITKYYNRKYLAEMKLDLTSFRQLKRLGKNPERQAKRYKENFEEMLLYYEQTMYPLKAKIDARNPQISADIDPDMRDSLYIEEQKLRLRSSGIQNFSSSLGIVSSAFSLVNSISSMIAMKKREKEMLVREFISDAGRSFELAQIPEWGVLGIPIPELEEFNESPSSELMTEEVTEETDYRSQELPPTDLAALESIYGQIYMEVYNESTDQDEFMNVQEGNSQGVEVSDYGTGDASFDLVIGKKKKKRSQIVNRDVISYSTSDAYGAGTMYRVKAIGNGYVYIFSVNSGNKMFSIFPHQGDAQQIPGGTYYQYPENAQFDDESGNVSVSIPESDYYIEIDDSQSGLVKDQETMVALFSRSQLDFRDVLTRLEGMSSDLSIEARIAKIFGSMAATPEQGDVYINDGSISYYLGQEDPMVLPVVIGIRRR